MNDANQAKRETRNRVRPVQDVSAAQDPDALLTIQTVAALIGFKPPTIREWSRAATDDGFPKPRHIGRHTRWKAREVRAWMKGRADGRPWKEVLAELMPQA